MITEPDLLWRLEEFRRLVAAHFLIEEAFADGPLPAFAVRPVPDTKARFLRLRAAAEPLDVLPVLRRRDGRRIVAFVPRPPRGEWRWPVNAALFAATLITTFLSGYFFLARPLVVGGHLRAVLPAALSFSLSLMLILGTHEAGHKVLSIRRGVDSSWPYFIPMTPPFGTMGAVIITRTPAPNRDALIDVAAAGPLAGFAVCLPILYVGVANSFVIDAAGFRGFSYPDPLLLQWMVRFVLHPPEGTLVLGHPMLFAGWLGLLVTSLNLLPAGMLDGGHVVRALLGSRLHMLLSGAAVIAAVLLGVPLMALVILILMRRGHPGPLDDVSPASPARIAVALALVAVFIVSVVPLGRLF